jgi:tRNA threonylcarbamoyladenosine biosynthesis protein TsaE
MASMDETKAWAVQLFASLKRPCLVLLSGVMGAGKTQLVRWMLEAAGVEQTASPTFAIHHQYRSATGPIDHFDLYRLQSMEDLESTGFWDLLRDPQSLAFVEWSDRLDPSVWPTDRHVVRIHIEKTADSSSRKITCSK